MALHQRKCKQIAPEHSGWFLSTRLIDCEYVDMPLTAEVHDLACANLVPSSIILNAPYKWSLLECELVPVKLTGST